MASVFNIKGTSVPSFFIGIKNNQVYLRSDNGKFQYKHYNGDWENIGVSIKDENTTIGNDVKTIKFSGESVSVSNVDGEININIEGVPSNVETQSYSYESTEPATSHFINHGLNSYFLKVDILVEDPDTLTWNRDYVGTEYLDENNIRIDLTEYCNVKVSIVVVSQ